MNKEQNVAKLITTCFMCMVMVVSLLAMPQMTQKVYAAGTVNAPSQRTFWTQDELMALTGKEANEPYYTDGIGFQEAFWGRKTWYVIGAEHDSLVMLANSEVGRSAFDMETNRYDDSHIYQCLNGDTNLPVQLGLIPYHLYTLFSEREREYMQAVNLSGISGSNWLYLPSGELGDKYFKVGSMDQYYVDMLHWKLNNDNNRVENGFWLRSRAWDNSERVLNAYIPQQKVSSSAITDSSVSIVPVFHLCIDQCLFASAAPFASSNAIKDINRYNPLTFRMSYPVSIKCSTAEYSGSKVAITKSSEETQPVYLCVQYNDGANDKIYTKLITSSQTVDLSDTIGDLSKAKIWLEMKSAEDNVVFATMATGQKSPVDRVDVNGYVTPAVGQLPVKPTIPANDDYNVNRIWYEVPEVGNTSDARALDSSEKIECGKVYCLALTFTTKNGKVFDENVTVYVDGNVVKYEKIADNKIRAYVYTAVNHDFSVKDVTKATTTANGQIVTKCSVCGEINSTKTIKAVKTIKLSATTYTYDGKAKKPTVTVKDSAGTTLKKDTDYTVTYATGRKAVGKYKVTIKGKGNYSFTKSLYFKINPVKTSITSLTKGTKSFTVKWAKKTTQTTGYEIQYSTSSTFKAGTATKKVIVKSNKTTSKTIKSLKAKKKYYVRVRTYKTVSGTKYYSAWCTKKYVTTK